MENNSEIFKLIRSHLAEQRFAVLATQSSGQPYANLVAFAEVNNLRSLLFVTSRDTQKYANSQANRKVAILIDNTKNRASDLRSAVAITALGAVEEVGQHEKDNLAPIYLAKHPELKAFLGEPGNALMKISLTEYIIATFDKVWHVRADEIEQPGSE